MTTITIKSGEELSQTLFENIDELTEYIYNIYLEKDLPPLSEATIKKAIEAKKEILSPDSTFRPAL